MGSSAKPMSPANTQNQILNDNNRNLNTADKDIFIQKQNNLSEESPLEILLVKEPKKKGDIYSAKLESILTANSQESNLNTFNT